jgi:SAM-dependent methyltransferase
MQNNIAYQTDQIAQYFSTNRVKWDQFYQSERVIIEQLRLDASREILDIGCGCGGLGLALQEKFGVTRYTGVEINPGAAQAARSLNPGAAILCGDMLDLAQKELQQREFDVVFSLSCVDWNVRFADMLEQAWRQVRAGGTMVATFRLTAGEGCNDMEKSFQYINYQGVREGECASYVVLNAGELIDQLDVFNPAAVNAFGYFGPPSSTAVTPYDKLCFAAFSIQKRAAGDSRAIQYQLDLPAEITQAIGKRAGADRT